MADTKQTDDDRNYSHLLTLLSVSAAMVGVCLTAVGLVSVIEALNKVEWWVDDLLAVGSLLFSLGDAAQFPRHPHANSQALAAVHFAAGRPVLHRDRRDGRRLLPADVHGDLKPARTVAAQACIVVLSATLPAVRAGVMPQSARLR